MQEAADAEEKAEEEGARKSERERARTSHRGGRGVREGFSCAVYSAYTQHPVQVGQSVVVARAGDLFRRRVWMACVAGAMHYRERAVQAAVSSRYDTPYIRKVCGSYREGRPGAGGEAAEQMEEDDDA